MKIVKPSVMLVFESRQAELLRKIEMAGRTCYKSEMKTTENSAEQFVRNLIRRGHESVLEHVNLTFRIICDRGVSHELVRHRMASYSQESTRYCNYSGDSFGGEITVVEPSWASPGDQTYEVWRKSCAFAEMAYFDLLSIGCYPQEARAVLPNSLKTEVVMTANIREWRHFLKLRLVKGAHPDMRVIAKYVLDVFLSFYPVFVEDIDHEQA